ncbi:MAG TPA: hypothetical protein VGC37_19395, partial [Friedmanniella sp.]
MDPTGAGRMRGFRAPGADGLANPPVPPDASTGPPGADPVDTLEAGPSPAARKPRRTASWRWLILAGAVLVVAMAVIGTLAFRLGSTSAASDAATSPSPTPTPAP